MSIKSTIDSAKLLASNGMHNDALTLVLLAISASSRKEFSKAQIPTDNAAFKKFFLINLNQMAHNDGITREEPIHGFEYTSLGKSSSRTTHSLEEIIYEQYRCSLVHEGDLPNDVFFISDGQQAVGFQNREVFHLLAYDYSTADMCVTHDNKLVMHYGWLDMLIKLVEQAEINIDLFGQRPINPNLGIPRVIFGSVKAT